MSIDSFESHMSHDVIRGRAWFAVVCSDADGAPAFIVLITLSIPNECSHEPVFDVFVFALPRLVTTLHTLS